MNKALYIILINLLGLAAAAGVWHFIIGLQIGAESYTLQSYRTWFLVVQIPAFTGALLLLKYYYDQKYRLAFFTGAIAFIASFGYGVVFYIILSTGALRGFYLPSVILNIGTVIIYAVSLIFSNTRKKFWIKLAGISGLVVAICMMIAILGGIYSKDVHFVSILKKITQWSPLAWSLINGMFIKNLLGEIETLPSENTNTPKQLLLVKILGPFTMVAFIFTIITGILLFGESSSQLTWRRYNAEQARQLVTLAGGVQTFVDSRGDSLHYILIKPYNYDKQKKYPLVVCLPYGGYEAGAAESLSTGLNRSTYPAFIFVPYCPDGLGWGGIPGTPSLELLVFKTIGSLNEPGIDIKRRYITGVSRGGYGTWRFISARPDLFAAAVPVCGGGDPLLAPKITNIPLWAFHGANDKNVPVSGSRDMISAIKQAGGHPLYTEYPDEAHNIWDKVNQTPDLWRWLFAQKQQ